MDWGIGGFSLANESPGEMSLLTVLGETLAWEVEPSLWGVKAGSGESFTCVAWNPDTRLKYPEDSNKESPWPGRLSADLLLPDEPFSVPDNPLRLEMQQFLGEIRRDYNIPIILVTQDLSEVNAVADKVTIYSQGKIAQIGPPVEIGRNPINAGVRALSP